MAQLAQQERDAPTSLEIRWWAGANGVNYSAALISVALTSGRVSIMRLSSSNATDLRAVGVADNTIVHAHTTAISEATECLAAHAEYSRVHNPVTGEKLPARLSLCKTSV